MKGIIVETNMKLKNKNKKKQIHAKIGFIPFL